MAPRARSSRLFDARDAWEREYILSALAAFEGNISRTADALGLERSNLYKKMRALGISGGRREEELGSPEDKNGEVRGPRALRSGDQEA